MGECLFEIRPELLRWAIGRSGRSEDELARVRGLGGLKRWLAGAATPTLSQAESFARATYTPFGYLALSKPPYIPPSDLPHFGNDPGDRSVHFEDILRAVRDRQEWASGRLYEYGVGMVEFVESVDKRNDSADNARSIRETLGLKRNGMAHMIHRAEDSGLFVSVDGTVGRNPSRRLDQGEFDGFALADGRAPFVFVNSRCGMPELALAHGLAQVMLNEPASFDLRAPAGGRSGTALACYMAASELLVPTSELLDMWDGFVRTTDPYGKVAKHFGVGRAVAVRRAMDAGCGGADGYDARASAGVYRPDVQTRVGKRLLRMVFASVGGCMLYRDAYYMTGLNASTFDRVREEMKH